MEGALSEARAQTIEQLSELIQELELASRHASTARRHFSDDEVPRGCAHVLALEGHLLRVRQLLDGVALRHAAHAQP
jgi:hypothetical protein